MRGLTILLLLVLGLPATAAEGPLTSTLSAFRVTVADDGSESLVATEEISPGETIEYHLVYKNNSAGPLTGLLVSIPVPGFTEYQADSADANINFQLQASLDRGTTFEAVPIMRRQDDGSMAPVPASSYTNLRWVAGDAIGPGETQTYTYRVVVQQ